MSPINHALATQESTGESQCQSVSVSVSQCQPILPAHPASPSCQPASQPPLSRHCSSFHAQLTISCVIITAIVTSLYYYTLRTMNNGIVTVSRIADNLSLLTLYHRTANSGCHFETVSRSCSLHSVSRFMCAFWPLRIPFATESQIDPPQVSPSP